MCIAFFSSRTNWYLFIFYLLTTFSTLFVGQYILVHNIVVFSFVLWVLWVSKVCSWTPPWEVAIPSLKYTLSLNHTVDFYTSDYATLDCWRDSEGFSRHLGLDQGLKVYTEWSIASTNFFHMESQGRHCSLHYSNKHQHFLYDMFKGWQINYNCVLWCDSKSYGKTNNSFKSFVWHLVL